MQKLRRFIVNFEEMIAGLSLFLMTSFVFINVFGRLFFNKSFAALDELGYLLFAYVIFMGSSSLYKRFGHGVIDLVVKLLPKWMQAGISFAVTVLLVVSSGILTALSTGYCIEAWTRRTQTLRLPYSFTAFALVLAFFCMTIHSIMFLKNVIVKKDYFHEVPIYENIYVVDSVEDMVADTMAVQAETAHDQIDSNKTGGDR